MRNVLQYENRFRPNLHVVSLLLWIACTVALPISLALGASTLLFVLPMMCVSAFMAIRRARAVLDHYEFLYGLTHRFFDRLPLSELREWVRQFPDRYYLGQGFRWTPIHSQRLYQARAMDPEAFAIPRIVEKWFDRKNSHRIADPNPFGNPILHGVSSSECSISYAQKAADRQTAVVGTTGTGKTTLLLCLAAQDVLRGDSFVGIVDPKGAKEIPPTLKRLADSVGRPFVYFHPLHASKSALIDMVGNWMRVTELASRIVAQYPNKDSFSGFMWLVLHRINSGLVYVGEKPSLTRTVQLVQSGVEELLEQALAIALSEAGIDGDSYQQDEPGSGKRNDGKLSRRGQHMLRIYEREIAKNRRIPEIDGLVLQAEHSKEHYMKMLASGLSLLVKMVSDSPGELMSPDYRNFRDTREVWTFDRLVRERAVLYLGLDALSDSVIGTVIASLAIANVTSVAGERYNTGDFSGAAKLHVDEAGEAANEAYIQILNKGGEARVSSVFYVQATADLEKRLESRPGAVQMLANANNVVALRCVDADTQTFFADKMGKAPLPEVSTGITLRSSTEENLMHFGGGLSGNMSLKDKDLLPPDVLGELPNLQAFAHIHGGEKVKIRVPILDLAA